MCPSTEDIGCLIPLQPPPPAPPPAPPPPPPSPDPPDPPAAPPPSPPPPPSPASPPPTSPPSPPPASPPAPPAAYCDHGHWGLGGLNGVCCADSCGTCSDKAGCADLPGGLDACCPSRILSANVLCSTFEATACVLPQNSPPPPSYPPAAPITWCDQGILGPGGICCAKSCGSCGGRGCWTRPGGSASCCKAPIQKTADCATFQDTVCMVPGYG